MNEIKAQLERKRELLKVARQELHQLLESRRDSPGFADISVVREAVLVLISSLVFMDEWVETIEKRVELMEGYQLSSQHRGYILGQLEVAESALQEPYPSTTLACGIVVDALKLVAQVKE